MKTEIQNGIYAAALTPMNKDLSCDSKELSYHCKDLLKQGCRGIALFGTTGEGPSFSVKERLDVLKQVINEGVGAQKIILGNGASNIPDTVYLINGALKNDVNVFLICPPTFYKNVTDDGVCAYYREIIKQVSHPDLQIILYHIPQYSGVPLSLKIIETLTLEFPETVVGIKESEGNISLTKSILEDYPGFKVFVGNESHITEAVHLGASGSICGMANLYPELICSLYDQGLRGDLSHHEDFLEIFQELRKRPFIASAKAFMAAKRGSAWLAIRPPLVPLSHSIL